MREEIWHAASNRSVPCLDLLLMLLLLAAAPLLLLLLLSLLETSLAIANQMALAAEFVPVSGIRALFEAPRTARIEQTVQYCP